MATTNKIPTPKSLPVIGVVPWFFPDPLRFLRDAALTHGDVVAFNLGPQKFVLVSSPEGVRHVLHDEAGRYRRGLFNRKLTPLFGEAVFSNDTPGWARQRRTTHPSFFADRMLKMADRTSRILGNVLESWTAPAEVDIEAEMAALTHRLNLRLMFGRDGAAPAGEAEVQAAVHVLLEDLNRRVSAMMEIPRWVPTPWNRRVAAATRVVDAFIDSHVAQRRANPEPVDMLSSLLAARDPESGQPLGEKQLHDELVNFTVGGHQPMFASLGWFWWLVAGHPAVDSKLSAEVQSVLGGRAPAAEDYTRLKYVRATLDEGLRLYPPTWMMVRLAVREDQIAGYEIRPGTQVAMSPYVLHRHPAYWKDPETFDPDRFLPGGPPRQPYTFIPFSLGPHTCTGEPYSYILETQLAAMVVQRFRFEPVPDAPPRTHPRMQLRPQQGIRLRRLART